MVKQCKYNYEAEHVCEVTKGQQLNKQFKLENIDEYCLTNFIAKSKLSEHHLQQCKLTNFGW